MSVLTWLVTCLTGMSKVANIHDLISVDPELPETLLRFLFKMEPLFEDRALTLTPELRFMYKKLKTLVRGEEMMPYKCPVCGREV